MIYEAYNSNTIIQFLNEADAINYSNDHSMNYRTVVPVIESLSANEHTKEDWLNLEQSFYQNATIFQKAVMSSGTGFALLSKVFSDGKTTGASENALQLALGLLLPSLNIPYTTEEIDYINSKFIEYNFITQI